MELKRKNVRLSFPDLFEPRAFKPGMEARYKATFLIEKGSDQEWDDTSAVPPAWSQDAGPSVVVTTGSGHGVVQRKEIHGRAADFPEDRNVRGDDRQAAAERFHQRQPEAFHVRGRDQGMRLLIGMSEFGVI